MESSENPNFLHVCKQQRCHVLHGSISSCKACLTQRTDLTNCHNLTQPQFELVRHNNELTKSFSSSCVTSTRNSYPSYKQPRELKFWIQLHFSNPKLEKTTFKINKWGGVKLPPPPPIYKKRQKTPNIFSLPAPGWLFLDLHKNYCHNLTQPQFELV